MYVFLIIRNCLELSQQQQGLKLGSVAVAIAYLSETLSVPLCLTLRDSVDVAASSTFYWPDCCCCCCCSLPLSLPQSSHQFIFSVLSVHFFQFRVFYVPFTCLSPARCLCLSSAMFPSSNKSIVAVTGGENGREVKGDREGGGMTRQATASRNLILIL